jgi:hypothetical protein
LGGLCRFLHFHALFYTFIRTCINPISRLIAFFGFLSCVPKKEKHTFDWAKTYITKFMEIDQEEANHELNYASKVVKQHVGPTSTNKENIPP